MATFAILKELGGWAQQAGPTQVTVQMGYYCYDEDGPGGSSEQTILVTFNSGDTIATIQNTIRDAIIADAATRGTTLVANAVFQPTLHRG